MVQKKCSTIVRFVIIRDTFDEEKKNKLSSRNIFCTIYSLGIFIASDSFILVSSNSSNTNKNDVLSLQTDTPTYGNDDLAILLSNVERQGLALSTERKKKTKEKEENRLRKRTTEICAICSSKKENVIIQ